jgi:NTE family protein
MNVTITPFQHDLLISSLTKIFGEFDTTLLAMIEPKLDWVEISGGEMLFAQNATGDSLYFVISGRLQATLTDLDGKPRKLGEVMRGETVGEMAIFTGEPRSATITAIRDTVLVRLSKEVFEQVIQAYPLVSMNVTRLIIARLRTTQEPRALVKKPVNICLVNLHKSIDLMTFTEQLSALLAQKGTVYVATGAAVDAAHGQPGISQAAKTDSVAYRQLSRWLDEQESQHEFMLYVIDPPTGDQVSEWTRRCLRQADEVLLLADATEPPVATTLEKEFLSGQSLTGAKQTLVLLHPPTTVVPQQTDRWLQARPLVSAHYHLRQSLTRDLERLARVLSGTAIGLVLAGGGAKGFAHLGVLRALQEANIPVDFVGGTSMGALVAAAISYDQPMDITCRYLRQVAMFNPTKDYNLLPFISLIRGQRMLKMIQNTVRQFSGQADTDLEDSWLTLFALSSNYSQAREEVHRRGSLTKYMRASSAIPGVFPPVIDGDDLLIDGGTFNNFPADVMNRLGVGKVIGVDLVLDKPRKLNLTEMPGPNALLRDQFRPKRHRKYRLPSLVSIMLNTTLLYSSARRTETKRFLDLYFNPDVSRYGLLNWAAFDQIVEVGYEHARQVLADLSDEERATFQG